MKFAGSLSALLVVLPLISSVSALAVPEGRAARFGRAQGGKFGGGKGQQGQGGKGAGAAAASTTAAAATATTAAAGTGAAAAAAPPAAAAAAGGGDLQSSTTIDPSVIQTTDDGQNPPTAGQSAAQLSKNNFANLCATTLPQVPLTNGLQTTTGSCNPIPIGMIPSVDNMPSSKFQSPANLDTIAATTPFNITLKTQGIQLGTFTNAQKTYFANPQTLNAQGQIIGHTHVVVEAIDAITTTTISNPQKFIFFKGVDDAADGQGNVVVPVAAGLAAGAYRMCTIVSSSTHQPAIVAVAQHGSVDDCVYVSAGAAGAAAAGKGAAAAGGKGAAAAAGNGAAAASTSAAAGAAAASAATGEQRTQPRRV
ncbi:hypothetical protein C8R47DRAFT_1041216 [Mycena vitilis]|nr:hypothetical protein C8R47DRAFT_1041216 [Mycena vitilis]